MKFQSTRFGTYEVKDNTLLTFPSGILGFPEWTRYVLLDHDTDAPFKWLQCVEEAQLAFVVLDPVFFKSDYQIEIPLDATIEIQKTGQDRATLPFTFWPMRRSAAGRVSSALWNNLKQHIPCIMKSRFPFLNPRLPRKKPAST